MVLSDCWYHRQQTCCHLVFISCGYVPLMNTDEIRDVESLFLVGH